MKRIFCKAVLICCMALLAFSVKAQEEEPPKKSNHNLAKELANPNTTLGTMAFPIDFIKYSGTLPDANTQFGAMLNFQPSLPVPLKKGFNLFIRPLIPIYLTQPTFGANGFEQKGFNLGNINADVAVCMSGLLKQLPLLVSLADFQQPLTRI